MEKELLFMSYKIFSFKWKSTGSFLKLPEAYIFNEQDRFLG